jgi:hypothetical protein
MYRIVEEDLPESDEGDDDTRRLGAREFVKFRIAMDEYELLTTSVLFLSRRLFRKSADSLNLRSSMTREKATSH